MLINHATPTLGPICPARARRLRGHVDALAEPRHYLAQPRANRSARDYLSDHLAAAGLQVSLTDSCQNVLGLPRRGPLRILVGAHYDSVAGSPGADDNASALAVLLEAAVAAGGAAGVGFVAFNREEEGLVGSREFAGALERHLPRLPELVHVLEMVGFTGPSQTSPLPILLPGMPSRGDFLGILAQHGSRRAARELLMLARELEGGPPLVVLRALFGIHKHLPDLERSDHAPFWARDVPALLWTDTAEFRNPHYHQASDLPETLDYGFMTRVTALLVAALR